MMRHKILNVKRINFYQQLKYQRNFEILCYLELISIDICSKLIRILYNIKKYSFTIQFKIQDPITMKHYQQITLAPNQDDAIRFRTRNEPKYFRKVQVTVTAAAKMLNHATFGVPNEVMGLMTGFYRQEKNYGVFTVTDIIALPVESSETRVTADEETNLLIAAYSQWIDKIKTHNIIGWYHSHPSFGCWLSGIDVNTTEIFQRNLDPFFAIVIDPIKSANLQKVDMGAFRVYPKNYKEETLANITDVPRRKAVDFGVHYSRYYQLAIELVTNKLGEETLKNVEKIGWAYELSQSSFFQQKPYLTQQVVDEKLDFDEYLQVKQSMNSSHEEIKAKEKDTLKKVGYYAKERNVSLIDTAIKTLMF